MADFPRTWAFALYSIGFLLCFDGRHLTRVAAFFYVFSLAWSVHYFRGMKNLVYILLAALFLGLSSCRQVESSVAHAEEKVRVDTLRLVSLRADTFRIHDSVFIRESVVGDTIRIVEHHYRDRMKVQVVRDTIYQSVRDTIKIEDKKEEVSGNKMGYDLPLWVRVAIGIFFIYAAYIFYKISR